MLRAAGARARTKVELEHDTDDDEDERWEVHRARFEAARAPRWCELHEQWRRRERARAALARREEEAEARVRRAGGDGRGVVGVEDGRRVEQRAVDVGRDRADPRLSRKNIQQDQLVV